MLEALKNYIRPLTVASMIGVLLIGAVTAGLLEAVFPGVGIRFTGGVAGWFRAIPPEYYTLAGAGFTAYTVARSFDKRASVIDQVE